ncbi:VHS domain-containing protein [Entamoeba marina]
MSCPVLKLSQIVDAAVSDSHPKPCIKLFDMVLRALQTVDGSEKTFIQQVVNKMVLTEKGVVSKKEMYYCLCLCDYLIEKDSAIRTCFSHKSFVSSFESLGRLESSTDKTLSGLLQTKCLMSLRSWIEYDELKHYKSLYSKISFDDISFDVVKPKRSSFDENIEELWFRTNECISLIQLMIDEEKKGRPPTTNSINKMIKSASELYKIFGEKVGECMANTHHISSREIRYNETNKSLVQHIQQLKDLKKIKKHRTIIERTTTSDSFRNTRLSQQQQRNTPSRYSGSPLTLKNTTDLDSCSSKNSYLTSPRGDSFHSIKTPTENKNEQKEFHVFTRSAHKRVRSYSAKSNGKDHTRTTVDTY